MNFNKVNENFCVSEQITFDDLYAIKEAGFKTIICNRPDNESPDQPSSKQIEQHAISIGLIFNDLPIIPGKFTQENIDQFKAIYSNKNNYPIFAYCRTGTRSCQLWAISQIDELAKDEILIQTKKAGYDLTPLFA